MLKWWWTMIWKRCGRVWIWSFFEVLSYHMPEETEENNKKTSVRILSMVAEAETMHFLHSCQKRYCLRQLASSINTVITEILLTNSMQLRPS
jgi:hypothetical protein